jgi:hypothetical protein
MDGLQEILNLPNHSAFNGGGGGAEWSGFSWRAPYQRVANILCHIFFLLTYCHHLMFSHLNILSTCLIHSPIIGHVSLFIPPIIILHVIWVHMSCIFLLPPHVPSWRLCSQTSVYNTRSNISSSSNQLFPNTQK